jgi:hypothetical protein
VPVPALSVEALEALADRWRRHGAPLAEHLRRGLDDEDMDAITLPLGLTLSPEARAWWGWHDGVSRAAGEKQRALSNGFDFVPLAEAAQAYAVERSSARMTASLLVHQGRFDELTDAENHWPRTWFPLLTVKYAYIACDVSLDPSPVFYRSREEFELPRPASAASIGALVDGWIGSIDAGFVAIDRSTGHWRRGPNAPAEAEAHRHNGG